MVPKQLKRALLYNTAKYHALVNPSGIAVHIGTKDRCLCEYYAMRWPGQLMLNDADMERARVSLAASGWQIMKVRMAIFTDDVDVAKLEIAK